MLKIHAFLGKRGTYILILNKKMFSQAGIISIFYTKSNNTILHGFCSLNEKCFFLNNRGEEFQKNS